MRLHTGRVHFIKISKTYKIQNVDIFLFVSFSRDSRICLVCFLAARAHALLTSKCTLKKKTIKCRNEKSNKKNYKSLRLMCLYIKLKVLCGEKDRTARARVRFHKLFQENMSHRFLSWTITFVLCFFFSHMRAAINLNI